MNRAHYLKTDIRRLIKNYPIYLAIVGVAVSMWFSLEDYAFTEGMVNGNALDTYGFAVSMSGIMIAVCSTRGIESLRVYGLYDFQEDGENVPLKGFDEIAATVETKYENLLDESTYTVTRAKFYERAYINEDQQYTAEPIWYLEINDNNSQKYVMLVNAETGKEIYLM